MLKISFTGYLGADCSQKSIDAQVAISFSVAVTKQWKNRQGEHMNKTTWIGCTIWRKPEHTRIAEFLKRGQQVYIEGEPSTRAWIKTTDGSASCTLDCRVDFLELLGKAANSDSQSAQNNSSAVQPAASPTISSPGENDDLPF